MPADPASTATPAPVRARLGTFAGVFTPSILTILGIILFLRLGYLVGSSGLRRTLAVIAVANVISVLTSLSVAAISTNLRVKGGGDYYLISRTLGLGFGGAIGLVLFLAQSVSVGFYCMGFAEAAAILLPGTDGGITRLVAGAAVLALFGLAWLGADWATRFQYFVLAALTVALGVFVLGSAGAWDGGLLEGNWAAPLGGMPFWTAFAIFFPAVTGFTQGVSMSGDLANPARSIPTGVLSAASSRLLSLEESLDEPNLLRLSPKSASETPEQEFSRSQFREQLAEHIRQLPERERMVLSLYYEQELNLKEIGQVLDVSESRVCQIHGQAMLRLRSAVSKA
jgi:RNA polymerase sigma factor (sigma-70 family)